MTTIARLRMQNWKPYRGEQVVELQPLHYAISATRQDDPDRSNWCGKSSIPEAIDYCLTGRLPRSCRRKSDWIHRGEKKGEVELTLEDGSRAVRTLSTNASEKFWWFPSDGGEPLVGKLAEAACEDAIGLDREDFLTTAYFRQKEMARLVSCDPATRMEMVVGWLQLEPLQRCDAMVQGLVDSLGEQIAIHREGIRTKERMIGEAFALSSVRDMPDLEQKILEAGTATLEATKRLERAREQDRAVVTRHGIAGQAMRFDEVVQEGKALAQAVAGVDVVALKATADAAREEWSSAGADQRKASGLVQDLRRVACGGFDGQCPIAQKACPSRQFVVSEVTANREMFARAEEAEKETLARVVAKCATMNSTNAEYQAHEQAAARLQALRDEARRLKDAKKSHASAEQLDEVAIAVEMQEAQKAWGVASAAEGKLVEARMYVNVRVREIEDTKKALVELERQQRLAIAAAAVFGKQGAQRSVAEEALNEIEGRANDFLSGAGIDLSVRIEWAREGTGLAATCTSCGAAHPKSERVKACQRCGAERGPNLVNRLEIIPSDVSGAADDLAGVVVQLAASAWLRQDRASSWGVALLDEPFAQMDRANRLALGTAFPKILAAAGFRQSMVISHARDAEAAFPGRIDVQHDGKRALLQVR